MNIKNLIPKIVVFVIFLSAWHWLAISGWVVKSFLPTPWEVWKAFGELYRSGTLFRNSIATLYRVLAGFSLAAVMAVPLGILLGWYRYTEEATAPLIEILRTISPIAWIPLAILWFGIGEKPAVFIIFITSFFPILVATIHAAKRVDPILIKVALNFGATPGTLFRKVIFPASFPYIMIGLRIALGIAWVVVVAAEMVGMRSGLGYMILDARNFLRTDMVIAGMIVIGVIGFALNKGMLFLESRVEKHKQEAGNFLAE